MAVPKNKRYKQVVKYRRSLQKLNLILKKHLTITKFNNHLLSNDIIAKYKEKPNVFCECWRSHVNKNILTVCTRCFKYWIKKEVLEPYYVFTWHNVRAYDHDWYYPFLGWNMKALDPILIMPVIAKKGVYTDLSVPKKIMKNKN
jgi:hypothetical protein